MTETQTPLGSAGKEKPRSWRRWHVAFGAFALALTVFLAARAVDGDRWSDWGFGDAQTMLSLRQWEEGGWLANYLLFIPQGYAAPIGLLDEPGLRQHAHGTCPSASPRVGPRLWYTHYPSGYLVPYATLFRIGLDSMPAARLLSVGFSVAALALLYLLFGRLTAPPLALLAAVFYGLSPVFLGYADSIANQPIDDLLRFGFMLAVVLSTRAASPRRRQVWTAVAWGTEFSLSLCSFDSVFFLYVWLIGWDLLEAKGFRWKRYALFALAPVTAHGLQFLQNAWYLGFRDAWVDVADTFLIKSNTASAGNRWAIVWTTLRFVFSSVAEHAQFAWVLALLYVVYWRYLKPPSDTCSPRPALLAVLLAAGLAIVVVLPSAAGMGYQGRQMAPLLALLLAGVGSSIFHGVRALLSGERPGGRLLPYLYVTGVATFLFLVFFAATDRRPRYRIAPDDQDVLLAKALNSFPAAAEPIIFDVQGFRVFWDPAYVPGYPQIMPLLEYYAGSRPILCFDRAEALERDLLQLLRKSQSPFSPLLVSSNKEELRELVTRLRDRGVLSGIPEGVYSAHGRYVVDLTPVLISETDDSAAHP